MKGVEKQGRKENRGRSRLYCQLLSLVATVVASIPLGASDLQQFMCLFSPKIFFWWLLSFKESLIITGWRQKHFRYSEEWNKEGHFQMSSFSIITGHVLVFVRATVPH